jgi:peptidoglycan/LPS O-acetylase OafA/YrhL
MNNPPKSFDSLTVLRGAFAWWVTLYHVRHWMHLPVGTALGEFLSLGYLGVDFFFVLSGFVIFYRYNNFFQKNFGKELLDFMKLRVARLYPLHFVMSLAFLANPVALSFFSTSGTVSDRYSWPYYFASLFLVQNWGFFDTLRWNAPAWSISTEAFAYLTFPIILLFIRKVHSFALMFCVATILVAAFALIARTSSIDSLGDNIPQFGLTRCVFEFALGAITAWCYVQLKHPNTQKIVISLSLTFLILTLGILLRLPNFTFIPLAVGALILGIALLDSIQMGISSGWAVRIGEISYATYLSHFFIKDWFEFLNLPSKTGPIVSVILFSLVVFLASELLYRTIEIPGQRLLRRVLGTKRNAGATE